MLLLKSAPEHTLEAVGSPTDALARFALSACGWQSPIRECWALVLVVPMRVLDEDYRERVIKGSAGRS